MIMPNTTTTERPRPGWFLIPPILNRPLIIKYHPFWCIRILLEYLIFVGSGGINIRGEDYSEQKNSQKRIWDRFARKPSLGMSPVYTTDRV